MRISQFTKKSEERFLKKLNIDELKELYDVHISVQKGIADVTDYWTKEDELCKKHSLLVK